MPAARAIVQAYGNEISRIVFKEREDRRARARRIRTIFGPQSGARGEFKGPAFFRNRRSHGWVILSAFPVAIACELRMVRDLATSAIRSTD